MEQQHQTLGFCEIIPFLTAEIRPTCRPFLQASSMGELARRPFGRLATVGLMPTDGMPG